MNFCQKADCSKILILVATFATSCTPTVPLPPGVWEKLWHCESMTLTLYEPSALFDDELGSGVGLIVLKGHEEPIVTRFGIQGLNRRWDWNHGYDKEKFEQKGTYRYSIILDDRGTARYYDFKLEERTTNEKTFSCHRHYFGSMF